ncbi:hypothetical protein BHS06_27490 [Myxococcus xanthus]|uniref:SitA6 family polymorphic toxin lipoprotein n=1 Tax=Myxococcus xanthus TaxID=34 RepID=UPI00112926D2|nr:hypothetical protein BHS06_27490 [Myxococcus xanthus]
MGQRQYSGWPMGLDCRGWLLLSGLVSLLLVGCASTAPGPASPSEPPSSLECERSDEGACVVLACESGTCGLFDCEDVALEEEAQAAFRPVLAGAFRPPARGGPSFRHWRNLGIRSGSRPRMTFHFRYREGFLPALPRGPGKLVHHHLFPQQPELARWFRSHGVDIHKFTILIPEHVHRQLHSGKGRGGMWNQAWRDFRDSQQGRSMTSEELHRKAVELIFRFELTGPVVPYNAPVAPYQAVPSIRAP